MTMIKSENYTLPEGETSLPIVRLSEIENNADMLRKSSYMQGDVDWSNRLSYNWSPFAPINYDLNEQGIVSSNMWKDGSGIYSPSISTQYYKLTFTGMADGLINDLLERFLYEYDKDVQIISHPDFDNLYILDNHETKQIFASIGENVLYIRYHGYADIDRIITLASEKLSIELK